MKRKTALKLIKDELALAQSRHSPFHSSHEGYAVIREEVDELWEEIKANNGTTHRGVSEAVQIAAMALRYLTDLCEEEQALEHETKVATWMSKPDCPGNCGGVGCYSG